MFTRQPIRMPPRVTAQAADNNPLPLPPSAQNAQRTYPSWHPISRFACLGPIPFGVPFLTALHPSAQRNPFPSWALAEAQIAQREYAPEQDISVPNTESSEADVATWAAALVDIYRDGRRRALVDEGTPRNEATERFRQAAHNACEALLAYARTRIDNKPRRPAWCTPLCAATKSLQPRPAHRPLVPPFQSWPQEGMRLTRRGHIKAIGPSFVRRLATSFPDYDGRLDLHLRMIRGNARDAFNRIQSAVEQHCALLLRSAAAPELSNNTTVPPVEPDSARWFQDGTIRLVQRYRTMLASIESALLYAGPEPRLSASGHLVRSASDAIARREATDPTRIAEHAYALANVMHCQEVHESVCEFVLRLDRGVDRHILQALPADAGRREALEQTRPGRVLEPLGRLMQEHETALNDLHKHAPWTTAMDSMLDAAQEVFARLPNDIDIVPPSEIQALVAGLRDPIACIDCASQLVVDLAAQCRAPESVPALLQAAHHLAEALTQTTRALQAKAEQDLMPPTLVEALQGRLTEVQTRMQQCPTLDPGFPHETLWAALNFLDSAANEEEKRAVENFLEHGDSETLSVLVAQLKACAERNIVTQLRDDDDRGAEITYATLGEIWEALARFGANRSEWLEPLQALQRHLDDQARVFLWTRATKERAPLQQGLDAALQSFETRAEAYGLERLEQPPGHPLDAAIAQMFESLDELVRLAHRDDDASKPSMEGLFADLRQFLRAYEEAAPSSLGAAVHFETIDALEVLLQAAETQWNPQLDTLAWQEPGVQTAHQAWRSTTRFLGRDLTPARRGNLPAVPRLLGLGIDAASTALVRWTDDVWRLYQATAAEGPGRHSPDLRATFQAAKSFLAELSAYAQESDATTGATRQHVLEAQAELDGLVRQLPSRLNPRSMAQAVWPYRR